MTIRNFNFSVRDLSPRTATITIYRSTGETSAPSALTSTQLGNLSYNFSTGVISGLPAGWQQTPVEIDVTTTTSLFYSYDITVSESAYNGTQTFTNIGSPTGRISFGNDIQSDTFVEGSAGWRLERDTGDGEFSNVTVRGTSTVDSSTIGGDALVQWSLINEDDTLGGLLGTNAGVGNGIETQSTFAEFLRFLVEDDSNITFQSGSLAFEGRLTTGNGDGASKAAFTDSDLTLELQWQFLNASGSILGSTVQSVVEDYDDIRYESSVESLEFLVSQREFDDLSPPTGTTEVVLSIRWSPSVSSNWGISRVSNASLAATNLIPKSSDASAYISSDSFDRFAGEIRGGRGLRIHRRLLFSGSETSLSSIGLLDGFERDIPEKLEILVTWIDSNAPLSGTGYTSALLSCVHPGHTALDETGTISGGTGVWLGNVYAGSSVSGSTVSGNNYVCSIWSSIFGTALDLIAGEDQASNISEARIRRVWSVYR